MRQSLVFSIKATGVFASLDRIPQLLPVHSAVDKVSVHWYQAIQYDESWIRHELGWKAAYNQKRIGDVLNTDTMTNGTMYRPEGCITA